MIENSGRMFKILRENDFPSIYSKITHDMWGQEQKYFDMYAIRRVSHHGAFYEILFRIYIKKKKG